MLDYTTFFNVTGYSNITADQGCFDTTYFVTVLWTQLLVNITNTFYIVLCTPQDGCPMNCLDNSGDINCISSIINPYIDNKTITVDIYNNPGVFSYVYGFSNFTPADFSINDTRVVTSVYCPSDDFSGFFYVCLVVGCIAMVACIIVGLCVLDWNKIWLWCRRRREARLNVTSGTYTTFNNDNSNAISDRSSPRVDDVNASRSSSQIQSFNTEL
jgi:hypothetical protein